jgi:hypothetical protein
MALLEKRLKFYKKIKELSVFVSRLFGVSPLYFPEVREFAPIFLPGKGLSLAQIKGAAEAVVKSFPRAALAPRAVVSKILSLEEAIEKLLKRVSAAFRLSFREFASSLHEKGREKERLIVSFLAILELIRQGVVEARQGERGSDIIIETREIATPRYG